MSKKRDRIFIPNSSLTVGLFRYPNTEAIKQLDLIRKDQRKKMKENPSNLRKNNWLKVWIVSQNALSLNHKKKEITTIKHKAMKINIILKETTIHSQTLEKETFDYENLKPSYDIIKRLQREINKLDCRCGLDWMQVMLPMYIGMFNTEDLIEITILETKETSEGLYTATRLVRNSCPIEPETRKILRKTNFDKLCKAISKIK